MKLRLLVTETCDRHCAGCCNKSWDLEALPVCTDFSGYDELIMLTGGEPALDPGAVFRALLKIRLQVPRVPVVMYTARPDDTAYAMLWFLDGVTVTLHEQGDVARFTRFASKLRQSFGFTKTLRLNVFAGVKWSDPDGQWSVKRNIEWIKDCPLPVGEVFKRLEAPVEGDERR